MSNKNKQALSQSDIYNVLAEKTELKKTDIKLVFAELENIMGSELKKGQTFNVLGMFKVKVSRRAAKPARKGINPFTKEEQMFKAKPACNVVKVKASSRVKELV